MITIFQKSVRDNKVKKVNSFKVGTWVHVENPNDSEIKKLVEEHKLEHGHIKDALDPFEVPRLELEGKVAYIFTRLAQEEEGVATTTPFLVVIKDNALITISSRPLPFIKRFVESKIKFTTTQKTKLFLQIFSQINAAYNSQLTLINRQVRSTSVNLEDIDNKTIIKFVRYENILNDFLSALVPTNSILKNLLQGKTFQLYEDDKDLIEDLMLANEQLTELCRSNLKNIVNIRESYSTIMTNNLNRVIKMLTSITIVLTIPMIITGLYGMNVALPFSDNAWAFWIIILFTGITTATLLAFLNKNRWL